MIWGRIDYRNVAWFFLVHIKKEPLLINYSLIICVDWSNKHPRFSENLGYTTDILIISLYHFAFSCLCLVVSIPKQKPTEKMPTTSFQAEASSIDTAEFEWGSIGGDVHNAGRYCVVGPEAQFRWLVGEGWGRKWERKRSTSFFAAKW